MKITKCGVQVKQIVWSEDKQAWTAITENDVISKLQEQNEQYKQALEWIKECSTDYQSRNKAMDALLEGEFE